MDDRQITHYVGDTCPGGHRGDAMSYKDEAELIGEAVEKVINSYGKKLESLLTDAVIDCLEAVSRIKNEYEHQENNNKNG